jgi:hypothetical protein
MKITSKLQKTILTLFVLIALISFVNATVLVNTSVDKSELSTNEIGLLTINLYNSDSDIENYPIRVETTDNLVITTNEQQTYFEYVDLLKTGIGKEIKIKFKALNTTSETGEIFVYYGDELKFVAGTYVFTKELPILVKTVAEKRLVDGEDKIIIDFEIHNYSKAPIYNIAIQAAAPEHFSVANIEEIIPIIPDGNKISKQIEITPPLRVNGEQRVVLSYGYFDENNAHYFEESFNFEFTQGNNSLLLGIGIIVLVIAVLIYMSKGKGPKQDIKGTAEKAEEN